MCQLMIDLSNKLHMFAFCKSCALRSLLIFTIAALRYETPFGTAPPEDLLGNGLESFLWCPSHNLIRSYHQNYPLKCLKDLQNLHHRILFMIFCKTEKLTLPETNIAPESLGLEDEFAFEGLLAGAILSFKEGNIFYGSISTF